MQLPSSICIIILEKHYMVLINLEIISEMNLGSPTAAATAKSLQSCLTLCDPRDGSPPGSPVPGILQARTLEWVAIAFSDSVGYIVLAK